VARFISATTAGNGTAWEAEEGRFDRWARNGGGGCAAQAVCLTALVAQHGNQYLFACMMLAGLIQIAAGQFRLGKFIRLVPTPVMLGFVNGLAIVIGMAQLEAFKVHSLPPAFASTTQEVRTRGSKAHVALRR
jgi:MFS superfamily sulfate permease-like transporter